MEDASPLTTKTNATVSLLNMPGTTSGTALQIVRGSASIPGSESIRRVSVWFSSKNQTRDLSSGAEAYKLEVKAHMLLRGLHPT